MAQAVHLQYRDSFNIGSITDNGTGDYNNELLLII